MSADSGEITQGHRINPNSLLNLRPFQPGVSGNPGGMPKGTPRISDAYRRLIAMSSAELAEFKPANGAEEIALARFNKAKTDRGLPDTAEITDRLEGKAPQRFEHSNVDERERIIIRLQERFLARTGVELSRSEAVARLAELDPTLAAQLTDGS